MTENEELKLYREFLLFIWDGCDFYSLVGDGILNVCPPDKGDKMAVDMWDSDQELLKEGMELVEKVENSLRAYLVKKK